MLRYMTAGESHGEALIVIIDGFPQGLRLDKSFIDRELKRRMHGYGRGGRMKIESDEARVLSGSRKNMTIGSPVGILIKNKDFSIDALHPIAKPRPGHADLAGALKYDFSDIRSVLERSSARETAARVAAGAVAKIFLLEFGIDILSHTISIGSVKADTHEFTFSKIRTLAERSDLRCADKDAEREMKEEIDNAKMEGDSLGGVSEIIVRGAPVGLGTYTQWDRRMDGLLAKAVMSIPAVKGVEIGQGFAASGLRGSRVHDEIIYDRKASRFSRRTNNAGGIEGGITNGENIVLRAAMKPIATLKKPLSSVDIKNKKQSPAQVERADVTAVPACGVVAEAAVAIELAGAMIEKFGGDSLTEIKRNYGGYISRLKKY